MDVLVVGVSASHAEGLAARVEGATRVKAVAPGDALGGDRFDVIMIGRSLTSPRMEKWIDTTVLCWLASNGVMIRADC